VHLAVLFLSVCISCYVVCVCVVCVLLSKRANAVASASYCASRLSSAAR